jgi:hypothetical protein
MQQSAVISNNPQISADIGRYRQQAAERIASTDSSMLQQRAAAYNKYSVRHKFLTPNKI